MSKPSLETRGSQNHFRRPFSEIAHAHRIRPRLEIDRPGHRASTGCAAERRVRGDFEEAASGAQRDRPELARALAFAREGDVLVVWKMDRLARSLRQLIETVEALGERGIGFQSVTEKIDT